MNETVLALVGALAVYGLSSLALPQPTSDPLDEVTDARPRGVAEETATPSDEATRQG